MLGYAHTIPIQNKADFLHTSFKFFGKKSISLVLYCVIDIFWKEKYFPLIVLYLSFQMTVLGGLVVDLSGARFPYITSVHRVRKTVKMAAFGRISQTLLRSSLIQTRQLSATAAHGHGEQTGNATQTLLKGHDIRMTKP